MVLAALGLHEPSALLIAGENVRKRSGLCTEVVERVEVGRHPRADVAHRGDHAADGGEDPGPGELGQVKTVVEHRLGLPVSGRGSRCGRNRCA
jgi:hypothetical protein